MYENAVPVFEMKNKLSYYLHKAESDGPVFISNRGKSEFVLMTIEDYEKLKNDAPKEKSPFEVTAELRNKYGILEDESFDFNAFIESIKTDSAVLDHRAREINYEFNNLPMDEE